MPDDPGYFEKVASRRTEALFIALMICFLGLSCWRFFIGSPDILGWVFLGLSGFFLFYALNFRTLIILINPDLLKLRFGIFTWTLPLKNIESCQIDGISGVQKMGGAGIHFMFVDRRYRVSFNFLEHPKILIRLKRPRGPVQDISFSTRHPQEVLDHLRSS